MLHQQPTRLTTALLLLTAANVFAAGGDRIVLSPSMLTNESGGGAPEQMVDEQDFSGPFTAHVPTTTWDIGGIARETFPVHVYLDLGEVKHLSKIAFFDMHGHGDIVVSAGDPGNWKPVLTENGVGFNKWKEHEMLVTTRYVRLTKTSRDGAFAEVLLWEQTPEQTAALAERAEKLAEAEKEKSSRPMIDAGVMFGELSLIDEVIVGAKDAPIFESETGATHVETILGKPVRVLAPAAEPVCFGVRLGKYKLLEAGRAYLLTVDFPEDEPRAFSIENRGGEFLRGVRTGNTLGDVVFTYTNNNLESIDVPLSGEMRTFRQLFYLSERAADIRLPRGDGERPNTPEDGVVVLFSIPEQKSDPTSQGAAVWRVRLFDVPNPERFTQSVPELPDGLPRRHVFTREEMGDGAINHVDSMQRAYDDPVDHFRNKIKLQKFLGLNTFAKDLLEFGSNQGWDSGGNEWYFSHKFPTLWSSLIDVATEEGMDLLPYYEYAGSRGRLGLGHEKRAEPLSGPNDYTHIKWSESSRADITDPDTLTDIKKLMEMTVIRHKDNGDFVGVWIRPRIAQMPMSFSDATRARFAAQANDGREVSRADLRGDESLRERYYNWWFEQRRDFLAAIRDYLRDNGVDDATVLYTTTPKEPGEALWFPGWGNVSSLVTDQPRLWGDMFNGNEMYEHLKVYPLDQVVAEGWAGKVATSPMKTWSTYEWPHAAPHADPDNYADADGLMMTYPFNRLYTVGETSGMDRFQTPQGLAAIRFYPLNENTRGDKSGYYVADYDYAGPYVTLPEAWAVAHGDPTYLGYLSGYNYTSGFPEYTQRFNRNFLALPALPSEVVTGVTDNRDVVVRRIDTDRHGTYFAVVNTGLKPAENLKLTLPAKGQVVDAVTGDVLGENGDVTLSLEPAELKALHVPAK